MNFRHANKNLQRMDEDPDFRGGFSDAIGKAFRLRMQFIRAAANENELMAKLRPKYQAFPPGDHIREEIEYRGWSQADLARIMGRPLQVINQIINGRKAITARTARELEAALGTSAETWMNLETSYRLYVQAKPDPAIAARAKAHGKAAQPLPARS